MRVHLFNLLFDHDVKTSGYLLLNTRKEDVYLDLDLESAYGKRSGEGQTDKTD